MINPVYEENTNIHLEFEFGQGNVVGGRIHRLNFSYDGNLYVLVYTKDEEIYYRVNLKNDFHRTSHKQALVS